MNRRRYRTLVLSLALDGFVAGCGYHVAGHGADALPKTIHVISVPAIENKSTSFKIEQKLTAATIHEFLAKTNYKIVSDPNSGDAVLTGKVLSVEILPLLFQTTTTAATATTPATSLAQATAMMITMKCEVTLTQRENDRVLYHTDNFVFRGEYQLATCGASTSSTPTTCGTGTSAKSEVETFFQEGDPALDRMSKDFAARLVAAVTENY
jgi:outer membrane lipopolysaccharide assembly protein LptE/RlpB